MTLVFLLDLSWSANTAYLYYRSSTSSTSSICVLRFGQKLTETHPNSPVLPEYSVPPSLQSSLKKKCWRLNQNCSESLGPAMVSWGRLYPSFVQVYRNSFLPQKSWYHCMDPTAGHSWWLWPPRKGLDVTGRWPHNLKNLSISMMEFYNRLWTKDSSLKCREFSIARTLLLGQAFFF